MAFRALRSPGDVVRVGPQIKLLGCELTSLIDPDRMRQAKAPTCLLKSLDNDHRGRGTGDTHHRTHPAVGIDHGQNPDALAIEQLVIHPVHGPDLVRAGRVTAVIAEAWMAASVRISRRERFSVEILPILGEPSAAIAVIRRKILFVEVRPADVVPAVVSGRMNAVFPVRGYDDTTMMAALRNQPPLFPVACRKLQSKFLRLERLKRGAK